MPRLRKVRATASQCDNSSSPEGYLARIDNPLAELDNDQLTARAHAFADANGLKEHRDLFRKAGMVIKDPPAYRRIRGITSGEKKALGEEQKLTFWQQPKQLRTNIMMLCVAAIVQGWNQTAANGANLGWPQTFGIENNWAFSGINSAVYFSAAFMGCWLSDPLNEAVFFKIFFGRRAAICTSAIIILFATIGCAASQSRYELLICRILLGLGMGSKAAVVPVFTAEIAPARIRGSLVMTWQLFDAFGILLGFTANLAVSQVGCNAWRWQFACSLIPTVILLVLIFACVESPRFLIKHKQYGPAYDALVLLRKHAILAAKDLFYIDEQMQEEHRQRSQHDHEANDSRNRHPSSKLGMYAQNLWHLFSKRQIRRATVAAVVCMFGQQLCGVNVLAFYSSSFFDKIASSPISYDSGLIPDPSNASCTPTASAMQSLWFSLGIGCMNFFAAYPAYKFIDRSGRRALLLLALPFMCISMMAAGLGILSPQANVRAGIVGAFLFVFMFFYSWSFGPVPFTVSAEVFPLETRVPGMSFAVFSNFFGAGLLALFVPPMARELTYGGLLGLFAGFNLCLFILVFVFVRDTAGLTIGSRAGPDTLATSEADEDSTHSPDPEGSAASDVDGNSTHSSNEDAHSASDADRESTAPSDPNVVHASDADGESVDSQSSHRGEGYRMATILSLEELHYIFQPTTEEYCQYQWQKVLPWAWDYYIRRDKSVGSLPESFGMWKLMQRTDVPEPTNGRPATPTQEVEMGELNRHASPRQRTAVAHNENVISGPAHQTLDLTETWRQNVEGIGQEGGSECVYAPRPVANAPATAPSTVLSSDGGIALGSSRSSQ